MHRKSHMAMTADVSKSNHQTRSFTHLSDSKQFRPGTQHCSSPQHLECPSSYLVLKHLSTRVNIITIAWLEPFAQSESRCHAQTGARHLQGVCLRQRSVLDGPCLLPSVVGCWPAEPPACGLQPDSAAAPIGQTKYHETPSNTCQALICLMEGNACAFLSCC